MSAVLRRAEVRRIQELAAADGFTNSAIWLAEKIRALILVPSGSNGHGARRDAATRPDRAERETAGAPAVTGAAPSSGSRPDELAIQSGAPRGLRSWAQLNSEERGRLAAAWQRAKPAPAEFKLWPVAQKLEWLNANWPLDQEPKAESEEW